MRTSTTTEPASTATHDVPRVGRGGSLARISGWCFDHRAKVVVAWLLVLAAILEAWYGGQNTGTSLARVLFGDANPSGKLPVTFPRSNAQGPADPTRETLQYPGNGSDVHYDEGLLVGYRWYDATGQHPLFPFGFGLSYTTFQFSDLSVQATGKQAWTVTAKVTNTGTLAGAEVPQLYLGFPSSTSEPPKQLKGFTRITLQPGQTRTVTFTLNAEILTLRFSDHADRALPQFPGIRHRACHGLHPSNE
jgi:beta-glucosidase